MTASVPGDGTTTARPRSKHFADLLDEMVERQPERDFLVAGETRLSYRALEVRAEAVARGLYALGVRPGARVALLMSNRPDWFDVAFGTFKLGATLVPLSTWYRPWDIGHTLRHCEAQVLVTMDEFKGNRYLEFLAQLAPELARQPREQLRLEAFPALEEVVLVAPEAPPGLYALDEAVALGAEVAPADVRACQAAARPSDLAYILYTSGSTATPKGVMIEHVGCVENGFSIGERQHLTADDRVWLTVPLAWGLGSENALPAIMTHGGSIVLQEAFAAGEAFELFEREQVTAIYASPNIVNALAEHGRPAGTHLPALKKGIVFGSPEEIRRAIEDLGVERVCNIYGATETYGNACVTDADDPVEVRLRSQGKPLPGVTLRILDPQTRAELPAGETGEVVVGGYVVPGYWNDPEKTAEAFRDGQYLTGDLGFLDEDGRFHFVARMKDMIKTGGINVAPAEVEQFLLTHPAVAEAAVVGVPDKRRTELVFAFVRLAEGSTVTEEELVAYCRAQIASYKIPSGFHFFTTAEEVPRTSTGKVNKVELATLAAVAVAVAAGERAGD